MRLTAYQDIKGIWTVGVGHTGKDVHPGLTITEEQADDLLQMDLRMTEAAVSHLVKVALRQCGLDAVVSFTFNVGTGTRLWVGGLLDNADSTVPREGGSQG